MARMLEEPQGPSFTGTGGALDKVHSPTTKLVEELRQARLSLQRVASPELRLTCAIRALSRTESRLDRPLRVAVLGEINSGKSSLANLLAGIDSLPTAVISNTRIPTLLYYAPDPEVCIVHESGRRERLRGNGSLPRRPIFRIDVGLPSQRLRTMQILDLPGFIDPMSGCVDIDPAAHSMDVAIWCTMSTQAWKESERAAWEQLPPRIGSRGVLVATHCDLLHDPGDREKLLLRLREEAAASFRSILLLSTAEALDVMAGNRNGGSAAAWAASGAEALERALSALLMDLREQRAAAAARMTGRIAQRALIRIDDGLGLNSTVGHT